MQKLFTSMLLFLVLFNSCSKESFAIRGDQKLVRFIFGIKDLKPISERKFKRGIKKNKLTDYTHFILKSEGIDSLVIRGIKRYEFGTIHVFNHEGKLLIPNIKTRGACNPMLRLKDIFFNDTIPDSTYFLHTNYPEKYVIAPDSITFQDISKYLYYTNGDKVENLTLHPNKTVIMSWATFRGWLVRLTQRRMINEVKSIPDEACDVYLLNLDLHKKFDKGFRFDF